MLLMHEKGQNISYIKMKYWYTFEAVYNTNKKKKSSESCLMGIKLETVF